MKNNPSVFRAYSRYYDLLYKDKDYISEANYIHSLLKRQGLAEGNLLEFGSGTGKHGCLLASLGYKVHGIERSSEMVAQAQKMSGFSCQQGDICKLRLGKVFDAVLSLFHVVSYQITNNDIAAVFNNAYEHLKPGGIFIFDFWYSPAVYSQKPLVKVKRMEDSKTKIIRLAEPQIYPNQNRVDVNYSIFANDLVSGVMETIFETHTMRHFSLPEIDFLATTYNFTCISAEEFLTGESASENTWGVCVILRKNDILQDER